MSSVDELDSFVQQLITQHNLDEDTRGNILISLTEAVTNAIRHGNGLDIAKHVRVDVWSLRDKLRISVTDEGPGFEPKSLPDPTSPSFLEQEGGRGVFLMRALSDEIKFSKRGRRVEMCYEYNHGVTHTHPELQYAAA